MKLFYITNARIPTEKAHGIQIMKMAEEFCRQIKGEFTLILPNRRTSGDLKNYYTVKIVPTIIKLSVVDLMRFSLFENFFYWLEILSFGISSFFYILFKNPQIIYTRDFYLLPFLILTGVPIFYEAHYYPTNKIAIWMHKILIPKLAGVVVITNAFVNYFKEFNYKKILIAHDATDIIFFKPFPRKPNKKIIIGYIGRLSGLGEDKGGNILINAFRSIKNKNCELLIVGEKEKEKIPGVTFAGTRPYNEMPYYFNLIDIAVIPFPDRPHFRYFMSPLKLFDYMAAGKPIITSDLPSIREVLFEDNAVFCQPGDSDSLALGMEKLIKNKNLRLAMSKNNLILSKKYTWDIRAKKILDFIFEHDI